MNANRLTVMVVDDVEINIDMLVDSLGDEYNVRAASNGVAALRAVQKALPDLILLDIMMPGMDGFEVCRRLKEDPKTRDIPVIFLTALSEDVNEARGFEVGAVDYITKPFVSVTVKARVRTHLELKSHRDHLESLVRQRTRELAEAHGRLKALDAARQDYLHAISHELRTPANGLLGITELALWEMADREKEGQYRALFETTRERLIATIDAAVQLGELQCDGATIATVPVDLGAIALSVWNTHQESFLADNLCLVAPEARPRLLPGNEQYLRQSIVTLLSVARKMAYPDTSVMMDLVDSPTDSTLKITFQALPISEKLLSTFFDVFSFDRASSHVEDLSLSVPLAAHMIRAMGGSVLIQNVADGVEIHICLYKDMQGIQTCGGATIE
jgi:CheY-like chemotaxis protein